MALISTWLYRLLLRLNRTKFPECFVKSSACQHKYDDNAHFPKNVSEELGLVIRNHKFITDFKISDFLMTFERIVCNVNRPMRVLFVLNILLVRDSVSGRKTRSSI